MSQTDALQGFESVSIMHGSLGVGDHALNHTVLLRLVRGDELLLQATEPQPGAR